MIDTIKIRLRFKEAPDEISELFYPVSLNEMRFSPKKHINTRYNPAKTLAGKTEYTPTYIGEKFIRNGTASYYLAIEVSLPKLLFGNNVEELPRGETSLLNIVDGLRQAIERDMGLTYDAHELLQGEVAKIHIGKNFMFDDPGAPLCIIDTVHKSRADRLCDDNQTKYENLGFSFRLHTNNKEVILYDKKKDIEQSKKSLKRAIDESITTDADNPNSPIGQLLSDKETGTLRIEVRLNNVLEIRKAFPSISDDLSLENVILNAPILEYLEAEWQKATDSVSAVQLSVNDVSKAFESLASKFVNHYSLRDSLAVAAASIIVNEHGLNYLRSLAEKYYSKDAWYRFKKLLLAPDNNHPFYFKKVSKEIKDYEPIDLQKYESQGSKYC